MDQRQGFAYYTDWSVAPSAGCGHIRVFAGEVFQVLKTVILIRDNLAPGNQERHDVEDVCALLKEQFSTWPETARVYHENVSMETDVTPQDEEGVERLEQLEGLIYVVVYPGAFIIPYLPYIFAAVVAVASYLLAPSARAIPVNAQRNSQTSSPNNELSNRTNNARINGRIPDIFGTVFSTPDLIAAPYKIFVANSEVEFCYMCIGSGAYEIAENSFLDGGTKCINIPGTSIAVYAPYTSPNSGDDPELLIGSPINEPLVVSERCNSINGQVLKPPKSSTFVGSNNVAFKYPNSILLQVGNGKPFTDYFVAGDTITVTNASVVGGTPFSMEFNMEPGRTEPLIFGPNYQSETLLAKTLYLWCWTPSYAAQLLAMFSVGATITITQTTFRGPTYNTTTTIDLSGTYEIEEVYPQEPPPGTAWSSNESIVVVKLVDPAAVNSDWNLIDAEFPYSFFNDMTIESEGGSLTYDLAGEYNIIAVSPELILLDDPVSINSDWDIIDGLSSSAYLSSTIVSDAGPKWVGSFILDDVDRVSVYFNLVAENGLYKDNGTTQYAVTVEVGFEITPVDVDDQPIAEPYYSAVTIQGSSQDKESVKRTFKISTPFVGRCAFRVTRVTETDDAFTGTVVDEVRIRDVYSIALVTQNDFGNVTTIHTQIFGTASALAVKERKLSCKATRKIPARIGETSAFTEELYASQNTADIFCAVCLNKYIGGRRLEEIDIANIYDTIAEIEDYFGSVTPAQFNYTFDKDNFSFEETVNAIAEAACCVAYRRGNVIRLNFEKTNADSSLLFNHRNKIPNTERRTIRFGIQNDYDGLEFVYASPEDGSIVTLFLPVGYAAVNPNKVEAIGVQDHLHAYFLAWRIWNKMLYQRESIEFEATDEANLLILNDRILVSDGTRPYSQEGEVLEVSGLTLTLSQKVDFTEYSEYSIWLQHYDGIAENLAIIAGTDSNQVVLAGAPRLSLVTDGDRYARTTYIIVGDEQPHSIAFLVKERLPSVNMRSTVKAINYDARYYSKDPDYINEVIGGGGYGGGGGFTPGTGTGFRSIDEIDLVIPSLVPASEFSGNCSGSSGNFSFVQSVDPVDHGVLILGLWVTANGTDGAPTSISFGGIEAELIHYVVNENITFTHSHFAIAMIPLSGSDGSLIEELGNTISIAWAAMGGNAPRIVGCVLTDVEYNAGVVIPDNTAGYLPDSGTIGLNAVFAAYSGGNPYLLPTSTNEVSNYVAGPGFFDGGVTLATANSSTDSEFLEYSVYDSEGGSLLTSELVDDNGFLNTLEFLAWEP